MTLDAPLIAGRGRAALCARVLGLLALALLVACSGGAKRHAVTAADFCAATSDPFYAIESPDIVEASGLAASRLEDGVFWLHNDSGDTARVFAVDTAGRQLATFTLPGVTATDWEDMAIGPGADIDDTTPYLYLADIGDNAAARPNITIHRAPEPPVTTGDTPTAHDLQDAETITLQYPDRPHDAETLLIDPVNGDLVIVTKELATGVSFVFHAAAPLSTTAPITLEQVGTIDFKSMASAVTPPPNAPPLVTGVPFLPTAGDISPDGAVIAIRTYGTIWVWDRPATVPFWQAFTSLPCEAPSLTEQQGEALAFFSDGRGYATTSEGENPPLHLFSIK